LQGAHKELDDATANGDLTAVLAASAQALLISARQLSEDAKACRSEVLITDDGLCGSPADVWQDSCTRPLTRSLTAAG